MKTRTVLSLLFTALFAAMTPGAEIVAHRGASHDAPENTLAAFELAWRQQADAVELDIYLSQDGKIVCLHDKLTKRTTGIDLNVAESTLADLQTLDAGTWKDAVWKDERIPLLEDAIATMPAGKRLFIEIKCGPEVMPELVRVIKAAGRPAAETAIIAFDYETVKLAKASLSRHAVYWIVAPKEKSEGKLPAIDELIAKAQEAGLDGLDLGYRFALDRDAVDRVHAAHLKLFVWTVNNANTARKLAALGIDGITTDRPGWLREQLAANRSAEPEPPQPIAANGSLRVAVFQSDATPPLGTPVAYALARKIEDPLSARGIVLLGAGEPIVLCAVDWIGIANGGHDVWRERLAQAVGTSIDRVTVHVLHQHDGVRCDFSAEELLAPHGLSGKRFNIPFVRKAITDAAQAAKASLAGARPVTHLGVGQAKVDKVASNRRILGPDGRVAIARSSSYRIPEPILSRLSAEAKRQGYELSASRVEEALAAPEGTIDPLLKMLTFFDGDRPLVSLSYYATHPQSHFGQGDVTAEFVGLARTAHEQSRGGLPLVHFNGASGNVAAGKYNDGTPELRVVLTNRMADGMQRAWQATKKVPVTAADCQWRVQPVRLPIAKHLDAATLRATLENPQAAEGERLAAATKLAFVLRMQQGNPIQLSCLKLGSVYLVHMPGELFIEYQLAAQQMRPDDTVCMAAYGDGGPGYIGTEIAYSQGGYETQPSSSNTSPQVERLLLDGIRELLK